MELLRLDLLELAVVDALDVAVVAAVVAAAVVVDVAAAAVVVVVDVADEDDVCRYDDLRLPSSNRVANLFCFSHWKISF